MTNGHSIKFGYNALKTFKDDIAKNAGTAIKYMKNLPGPVKAFAALAGGAVLLNRAYEGGKVDGEHKAVNTLGKADAYTQMGQNLDLVSGM